MLSTGQAASLFGVTPRTIQVWADAGMIPCIRTIGGHRRFDAAQLQRDLAEGTRFGYVERDISTA